MLKLHKDILFYSRIDIIKQTLFIKKKKLLLLEVDKTVFRLSLIIVIISPNDPHKVKIRGRKDECWLRTD